MKGNVWCGHGPSVTVSIGETGKIGVHVVSCFLVVAACILVGKLSVFVLCVCGFRGWG